MTSGRRATTRGHDRWRAACHTHCGSAAQQDARPPKSDPACNQVTMCDLCLEPLSRSSLPSFSWGVSSDTTKTECLVPSPRCVTVRTVLCLLKQCCPHLPPCINVVRMPCEGPTTSSASDSCSSHPSPGGTLNKINHSAHWVIVTDRHSLVNGKQPSDTDSVPLAGRFCPTATSDCRVACGSGNYGVVRVLARRNGQCNDQTC